MKEISSLILLLMSYTEETEVKKKSKNRSEQMKGAKKMKLTHPLICERCGGTIDRLAVCVKLTELHEDSRIFMPTSFLIQQNKNIVLPFRIALMIVLQVVLLPTDLLFICTFVLGAIGYGIGKALGIINDDGDKRLQ